MYPEDYQQLREEYRTIKEKKAKGEATSEEDDSYLDIVNQLVEENDFVNTLDSEMAHDIIEYLQQIYLEEHGGWPFEDDKSFSASKDGEEYGVLAFGVSDGGNERPLILGMLFIK